MVSDQRLSWAADRKMAIREMAEVSSWLWASLSSSWDCFESFSPLCFSVYIFDCFGSSAVTCGYFLFVLDLPHAFLKLFLLMKSCFCHFVSCPMSCLGYKPTKVPFSMLIFLFTSSWEFDCHIGTFLSYSRPKISHFGFFHDWYFLPFVCFMIYVFSQFIRWWIMFFQNFPNLCNSFFTSILVIFQICFFVHIQ